MREYDRWRLYEAVKRQLQELDLAPAEYERMVQGLAEWLGV